MMNIILHGRDKFNELYNKQILLHTIDYSKSTKSFERPQIGHCLL